MRNPLSQTITNIQPSGIRKFFDIVNDMEDAISLGVGEPDFDTPWRIRDEAIYSLFSVFVFTSFGALLSVGSREYEPCVLGLY
jgi:aspartate/methionine/tyrosine aminotransferase